MGKFEMPPDVACTLLTALQDVGVTPCVGGGWAVDALVGRQTRRHEDLDLWVDAADTGAMFTALVGQGVDRIHPWPGDRPWNFVLSDGQSRRIDLHLFEQLGRGRLHYGSVTAPFLFTDRDVSGRGQISGSAVRCEAPEFALANHSGYPPRAADRHDVTVLCEHFGLELPESFRQDPDG